jgi:molybdopterin-binding protein
MRGDSNEDQRAQSAQGHYRRCRKGATTSYIRIDIGGGVVVTASIINEAVDELNVAKGKPATAVIKASDVMVGVD